MNVTLATILTCALMGVARSAEEVQLPEPIKRALTSNAEQVTPIDISLTMNRQLHLTPEELARRLNRPASYAEALEVEMELRVVWQNSKLYTRRQIQRIPEDSDKTRKETFEWATDGEIVYSAQYSEPPPEDAVISAMGMKELVSSLIARTRGGKYVIAWYFEAAGFELPTSLESLQAKEPPRSRILQLLDEGGKLIKVVENESIDGRELTRIDVITENPVRAAALKADLETAGEGMATYLPPEDVDREVARIKDELKRNRELPPRWLYTFLLDQKLGYSIVQWSIRYEDGTLLRVTECGEFQQLADRGVYLPKRCVEEIYSYPPAAVTGEPITTATYLVKDFNLTAAKDEQFVIDRRIPGMVIFDRTDPENEARYRVQDDGSVVRER